MSKFYFLHVGNAFFFGVGIVSAVCFSYTLVRFVLFHHVFNLILVLFCGERHCLGMAERVGLVVPLKESPIPFVVRFLITR